VTGEIGFGIVTDGPRRVVIHIKVDVRNIMWCNE